MADTYFKVKIICEYVIPLGLLAIMAAAGAGAVLKMIIQDKLEKRRKRKENGKVRKKDDAV